MPPFFRRLLKGTKTLKKKRSYARKIPSSFFMTTRVLCSFDKIQEDYVSRKKLSQRTGTDKNV